MARAEEGFQSESLQAALKQAVAGNPAELERLLARMGAVVTPRPNLRLAAAFGSEVAALSAAVLPLLQRLSADDAAPDTDRAFLPIAAAHGWAARVRAGLDVQRGWAALAELGADERAPVRLGTREALLALGATMADDLLQQAEQWLESGDRELRFGAAAMAVDVLGDKRVQAALRDQEGLRAYLSRVMGEVAGASRSAERSDARRRLLAALPNTLAAVVAAGGQTRNAHDWFAEESTRAEEPAVRSVLSDALVRLRSPAHGASGARVDELQQTLAGSAKPLRDPSRLRPGTGRGKATRRIR